MNILVTGGAGYIGSHTCFEMLQENYNIIVYDNLSNSSLEALKRVEKLTGKKIEFIEGDLLDIEKLEEVFQNEKFDAVIHFAGLKAVGESVQKPLKYYDNNVTGTLNLLKLMQNHNVKELVFSSSATVYGVPKELPLTESSPRSTTNPYGTSKLVIEYILEDLAKSDPEWKIISLRYFNPIGAHKSGEIGEDPNGIPNNLLPYISQVAVKLRKNVNVFGNDYDTKDGTGVRDYIHVVDLAMGHVFALKYLKDSQEQGFIPINLGTGNGYSVLEMIKAFEKASKTIIPYQIVERRDGDIAECYADPICAYNKLGWKAQNSLEDMCQDAWNWQKNNPTGYNKK
ncbi:UDP-glucose 4-epimerase GalE [Sulfurimonas microaerophilic]|uniref:UDP-glucose 4-epimerase GalE n=1 Tax=Sulfurimonas microaerophilic TaxID=3058392 RepID=UPI002714DFB8|nr:UDP-glucose 4-epimerase GalE [Sulfurimonas sp. hsl 1-7]